MNECSERSEMGGNRWLEALEWHTILCEADEVALTSGRLRAWQQWFAQSENQRTFNALSRLLADRPGYDQPGLPSDIDVESDRYDPSVPVRTWREAQQADAVWGAGNTARSRWMKASVVSILTAAAAVAAVLILRSSWTPPLRRTPSLIYQTRVGELTQVHLRDGSTVTLGGDSKLAVDYTAKSRSIQLVRGEAWFQDKDIPKWPFVVTAGNRTITALGTAFVVNRDADRVVVIVTAGTVEVSSRAYMPRQRALAPASATLLPVPAIRLVRNEGMTYSDDGTVGRVTQTEFNAATAWTQGRLVFDDVPLRYVIDNVDRYWSRHISVSPRAGELRFSGLVYQDQIEDWLAELSIIFPVVVDGVGANVCVHMRDSHHTQRHSSCVKPRS